jgi:S1-C subfamily serine protease
VAIQGKPVRSTEDLVRIVVGSMVPGETATFTVIRDGERIKVPVKLTERPTNPDAG